MKRSLIIIIILCTSMLLAKNIEFVKNFGNNPGHLNMYQYIPDDLETQKPCPMVLILHGSGQTAYALSLASGFNKLADSLGFIAVYPDQPFYNNLLTSFSFYMPGKMKKDQGETASIRNMIDYMENNYNIDKDRIFITGMSAGAAMSNVMLNAYPEIFAAGALFAAPSILHEGVNPNHEHFPHIAIIHGEYDLTVHPKNSDRIVEQWQEYLELENRTPKVIENYLDHTLLRLTNFSDTEDKTLIRLDIARTGHLLLVDPGKELKQGGQYSLFTKDVNFHLSYWICEFFGLASE